MMSCYTQRTLKTFTWPCEPIRLLMELLRQSEGLANRSFYKLDISRVQPKSNRTDGERLLASDQPQFDNTGQFYLNDNGIFYNVHFKN